MKFAIKFATLLVAASLPSPFTCEASTNILKKLSINNFSNMEFYSQASQDKFAYTMLYELLGKKDQGYYLEIGAGDPLINSNSYFFEKNFNWEGVSIDISSGHEQNWKNVRKNTLLISDATKVDYAELLSTFPQEIDLLSLDTDDLYDKVLEQIPFENYYFKVIVIEHDYYKFGTVFRDREREILTSHGYLLLCPDVTHPHCGAFEDWWIYPTAFPDSILTALNALDLDKKDHGQLVTTIKKLTND